MAKIVFSNEAAVSLSGHVTGPNFKICRTTFRMRWLKVQSSLNISGFGALWKENVRALLFSWKHCELYSVSILWKNSLNLLDFGWRDY
jgi:hypothetical protein